MTALWATLLVSSLVGSVHCVAMCGPLVGLHGGVGSLRLALVHALGRLTTYAVLGAAAGLVGRAVDLAGHLAAVQHVAAIVAGVVILGWGVRAIAIARGWLRADGRGGGALFQRGLVQLRTRRAVRRAWLVGVLTGLLPCGWLWAFVVSAAGTASPWLGAATMAVFWLGTVPAMTGVLALGGPMIAVVRRKLPVISACILIALGLVTLATRWRDAGRAGVTQPQCHRGAS
ncbi:MAG: sulfite exporter TauE/SafE family protein [Kofleriaceae bacterium]